jgi:hypothetical protein
MTLQIFDCDQGSDEWFKCRLGIPSASNFSAILAKGEGKTRRSYLNKLAAEIITGEVGESFQSQAMERGKVMEDEARDLYAFVHDAPLERVGFIVNGPKGCSPDSLIASDGGLEIKTQRADLLVETLLKGDVPPEHKAQVQGNIWVAERAWWDLVVYWPKMPLFVKRVFRDDAYIANLSNEVDRFNAELADTVARIRKFAPEAIAA